MTKKHFIRIAEIIREARLNWPSELGPIKDIEDQLAQYFKSENSAFDTQRFLRACKGNKND